MTGVQTCAFRSEKRKQEADKLHQQQLEQLERIANLTPEQAREQMMEAIRADAQAAASAYIKNSIDEAKLTATKEAKKIVVETIQRTAAEHAIENCVSVFNIESDDIKGKVIGREGRNIRALEESRRYFIDRFTSKSTPYSRRFDAYF